MPLPVFAVFLLKALAVIGKLAVSYFIGRAIEGDLTHEDAGGGGHNSTA